MKKRLYLIVSLHLVSMMIILELNNLKELLQKLLVKNDETECWLDCTWDVLMLP